MNVWISALLPLFFTSLALVFVVMKIAARKRSIEYCPEWLEDFSISKYRPMLRLLSEDDYEFLESQAGYQGKIASQLRAERRKVFRAYLRNLIRDFHRLQHVAKLMALCASQDRPELAAALLKQRVTFTWAVFAVRVRLALHTVGIGAVDVRNLIGSLDHLRIQVETMMPDSSPAA
jgi:hypothetical protein